MESIREHGPQHEFNKPNEPSQEQMEALLKVDRSKGDGYDELRSLINDMQKLLDRINSPEKYH